MALRVHLARPVPMVTTAQWVPLAPQGLLVLRAQMALMEQ
jgi:hypothetical protein